MEKCRLVKCALIQYFMSEKKAAYLEHTGINFAPDKIAFLVFESK